MLEMDLKSFNDAIQGEQPVVVDFWAAWCMPCKIFAPVLEELSDEMDGQVTFGKVNIDEVGELAQEYSVSSIPTVVVFQKGKELERMVGVRPKEEVREKLSKLL